ncbi:MAG: hypothetical protein ACI8RZ_001220 [Myxococcota bacterium]|jgi:hypothetical protein
MNRSGLGGLAAPDAAALVSALASGGELSDAARRVGLDARLPRVVLLAGVSDAPAALAGQLMIASTLAGNARRLRSAGIYPLILAGSVVVAGAVIHSVMAPALAAQSMPTGGVESLGIAVGLSAAVLVLLSVAVLGRLRLPLLSGGWPAIHRAAFFDSLDQLAQAGASLPAALRASAVWCLPGQARAAETLARALEAGETADASPLLHPMEASLLVGAARSGTVPQAAAALAAQERVRQQRTLPGAILRIHTLALLIASTGVLAVGVAFFTLYGRLIAG